MTTFSSRTNAMLVTLVGIVVIAVVACVIVWPSGPALGASYVHRVDVAPREAFVAPMECVGGAARSSSAVVHRMERCLLEPNRGWCEDRQGGGRCVPGQLTGPDDPNTRCHNWWYNGMCMVGPQCREHAVVPPPSLLRSEYHHPAPYYYRNWPWSSGTWRGTARRYPGIDTVEVVNTNRLAREGERASDHHDAFVPSSPVEADACRFRGGEAAGACPRTLGAKSSHNRYQKWTDDPDDL